MASHYKIIISSFCQKFIVQKVKSYLKTKTYSKSMQVTDMTSYRKYGGIC